MDISVVCTTPESPDATYHLDAAMVNGDPISDQIQLNLESLWLGGPFANSVSIFGAPKYQMTLTTGNSRITEVIIVLRMRSTSQNSWLASEKLYSARRTGQYQVVFTSSFATE